ncbi:MAG: hypothetical protein AAFQ09_09980 [Pseudomonadota bacterium]
MSAAIIAELYDQDEIFQLPNNPYRSKSPDCDTLMIAKRDRPFTDFVADATDGRDPHIIKLLPDGTVELSDFEKHNSFAVYEP